MKSIDKSFADLPIIYDKISRIYPMYNNGKLIFNVVSIEVDGIKGFVGKNGVEFFKRK